jgi:hypothetical protein
MFPSILPYSGHCQDTFWPHHLRHSTLHRFRTKLCDFSSLSYGTKRSECQEIVHKPAAPVLLGAFSLSIKHGLLLSKNGGYVRSRLQRRHDTEPKRWLFNNLSTTTISSFTFVPIKSRTFILYQWTFFHTNPTAASTKNEEQHNLYLLFITTHNSPTTFQNENLKTTVVLVAAACKNDLHE